MVLPGELLCAEVSSVLLLSKPLDGAPIFGIVGSYMKARKEEEAGRRGQVSPGSMDMCVVRVL